MPLALTDDSREAVEGKGAGERSSGFDASTGSASGTSVTDASSDCNEVPFIDCEDERKRAAGSDGCAGRAGAIGFTGFGGAAVNGMSPEVDTE